MEMNFKSRIESLKSKMPYSIIGNSLFGTPLYCFGSLTPEMVIFGGIHAREVASIELALRVCELIAENNKSVDVALVPLVNPDGLALYLNDSLTKGKLSKELANNFNPVIWKANGRGVDLNLNFDAAWATGKDNVFAPAPFGYVGQCPFSEPETIAVRDYLEKVTPKEVWALHSRGEVVYHGFLNVSQKKEAAKVALLFNYSLSRSDWSAGGLKDWYVLKHSSDGFAVTIELGTDEMDYLKIAKDDKYMDMLANRVYGYLISAYSSV